MPAVIVLGRWLAVAVTLALALSLTVPGDLARADDDTAVDASSPALTTSFQLVEDRDVDDRLPRPEDRYAPAGGCYTIEAPGAGFVARDAEGATLTRRRADAEPFHFQATRLGEYLLATNEGPDTSVAGAWWDERGFLSAERLVPEPTPSALGLGVPWPGQGLLPAAPWPTAPTTDKATVADAPSELGDWRIVAAGDDPEARLSGTERGRDDAARPHRRAGEPPDTGRGRGNDGVGRSGYQLSLPATGEALTVEDGRLRLADEDADSVAFAFHLVTDGGDGPHPDDCARWPEIETNTSGAPEPATANPTDEVEGFFEAHVHGMAYEFLGGEVRCGQPWHPYGVEYALGDCNEDGNAYNGVLEVAVAGRGPQEPVTDYDPVGWPTFAYWPAHDTLTHEQYYWRWLERAYHGGVRLTTNLLVDNVALCEVFPVKKNSCNEMDGVRLQAERVFALQDYIDAQSGGPGEGWFRVVTSPAQAREVINAGRMAVVLGIEVSELFDCREVLDVPQCSQEQIDERLDEVFDMGVRQMELINKFDNALSGVTGDGGETGLVVNTGNRWVTGHWWDMETCPDDGHDHTHDDPGPDGHDDHDDHSHPDGDEHDRRQPNVSDDTAAGEYEETDVLAGTILDLFAETDGYAAPVYPEGPHCNQRGLSELGEDVIEGMIERGMILDPDHMSALAQRQALDLVEHELVPAEEEAAAAEDRRPVQPGILSSHSWANDVVYQRIYQLDGLVAPRTASPDEFVDLWARHRDWADRWAPDGAVFGLGFGADTNGLGAQPGPRDDPATSLDDEGWQAPIGGVTIGAQTSGVRTYDIADDGVAHYGLFADWFRAVALAADEHAAERGGGAAIIEDMLQGPETFLQLWERAVYGGNDCVADQSTPQREDLHALLGANLDGFLTAAGQPVDREDGAYTYCVDDGLGGMGIVEVVFDAEGRAVELRPGQARDELELREGAPVLSR